MGYNVLLSGLMLDGPGKLQVYDISKSNRISYLRGYSSLLVKKIDDLSKGRDRRS